MCEKQGYIERFYTETPKDKVDFTIQDMQRYTKRLIEEETNLSNMIEAALKQNAREDQDSKNNLDNEIVDFDDIDSLIEDKDFEDFSEFVEGEVAEDILLLDDEESEG